MERLVAQLYRIEPAERYWPETYQVQELAMPDDQVASGSRAAWFCCFFPYYSDDRMFEPSAQGQPHLPASHFERHPVICTGAQEHQPWDGDLAMQKQRPEPPAGQTPRACGGSSPKPCAT